MKELRAAGLTTGIWWYADQPTVEKGERYLDAVASSLAHRVRLVKQDKVSQQLQAENSHACQ